MKYTLNNIQDIIFEGFDFVLPEETLKIISELALQVGSPDYVKTPVFKKRENQDSEVPVKDKFNNKKKRKNKGIEEDWDALSSFQPTKIETTSGIHSEFNSIRALINKISDKNYIDIRDKILEIIEKIKNSFGLNTMLQAKNLSRRDE
jgi:hypothetical protein